MHDSIHGMILEIAFLNEKLFNLFSAWAAAAAAASGREQSG